MAIIFLKVWTIFWIIGATLIFLRNDKMVIMYKTSRMFFVKNLIYFIFIILIIYVFIPLSIPSSINNIIKT